MSENRKMSQKNRAEWLEVTLAHPGRVVTRLGRGVIPLFGGSCLANPPPD